MSKKEKVSEWTITHALALSLRPYKSFESRERGKIRCRGQSGDQDSRNSPTASGIRKRISIAHYITHA